MRRFLERFGIWIVVCMLALFAVLRRDWVYLAIVGVAIVGLAGARPLDRRANRQMSRRERDD